MHNQIQAEYKEITKHSVFTSIRKFPGTLHPVLEQTFLHLLFMCNTTHAGYIQIAGLEINYL